VWVESGPVAATVRTIAESSAISCGAPTPPNRENKIILPRPRGTRG
jgi:hypothetical protein